MGVLASGSTTLHRREQRDFIAILQSVIRVLILQAHRHQGGFSHLLEPGVLMSDLLQQIAQAGNPVWTGPSWLRNHRRTPGPSRVVDGTPYPPLEP